MQEKERRFFKKVCDGVAVAPMLEEIEKFEQLWFANTRRQDENRVQENTQSITLREAATRPDIKIWENQESVDTDAKSYLPGIFKFLSDFAESQSSHLARARIVRLKPGLHVGMHTDKGSYYLIRNRFHLILKSKFGSIMQSGDEIVTMNNGELWWFDNKQHHSAVNMSDDWRVHVIFDLLPTQLESFACNPIPLSDILQNREFRDYVKLMPVESARIRKVGEEH